MDVDERSFTVEASSVGEVGGRYINRSPRRAASKAARIILDGLPSKQKRSEIRLQLRETTRGSKDKLFAYRARSTDIRKTINRGGKDILITQEIKMSKVPLFHGDGARRRSVDKKKGGGYYGGELVFEGESIKAEEVAAYADDSGTVRTLQLITERSGFVDDDGDEEDEDGGKYHRYYVLIEENNGTKSSTLLHNFYLPPPDHLVEKVEDDLYRIKDTGFTFTYNEGEEGEDIESSGAVTYHSVIKDDDDDSVKDDDVDEEEFIYV